MNLNLGNVGTVTVKVERENLIEVSAALVITGVLIILSWILANKLLK